MRQMFFRLSALSAILLLAACQNAPMTMLPPAALQAQRAGLRPLMNTVPLVGVEGFQSGDNLKVKGPFFTSGSGKVHNLTPDAFKIEFQIAGHHLIVDATRLDATQVRFITIDVKNNRKVETVGKYVRTGNTTVFDMGPGQEVEKLTVRAVRSGYFETDVVQPGRMFPQDERGSNTLKFSKG
ncbi:MAG: hypothetical protein ACO1RX_13110 [Candidatus Sericytochromatia bacterium]